MKILSERDRQAEELAREILILARNTILVELHFMDRAAGNIRMIPDMNFGFAGNGAVILYSPWTVIRTYMDDENAVTRNMVHCILHNVFRHSFTGEGIDRTKWDLACDIAVENVINEMDRDCLRVKRTDRQQEVLDYLRSKVTYLTAERIYSFICRDRYSIIRTAEWARAFSGGEHTLWYGDGGGDYMIPPDIDLEQLWRDISRRMQTELEVFASEDGALTQNLREINRVRYNYTEFLRKFGLRTETMKLSEEEFDNIYYTYGMQLYGNIPLVEPLEYRDNRNIRDFVIAIDTSGSVQGEVVQKFIQHTHDVLDGQSRLDSAMNLYILQCDDRIRDVAHITDKADFERYLSEKQIKGLGQTDFRPVFEYVDKLVAEGRLRDLRGLLYFTDGKGKFPAAAPEYDTAFIIHSDSIYDTWVPDWAMKIEMPTEEIMNL